MKPSHLTIEYFYSIMKKFYHIKNLKMILPAVNYFCWIAAVLPAVVIGYLIFQYSVDFPFSDDWVLLFRIEEILNNTFSFNDLFVRHNTHRIFFPLLLMLPLGVVSKLNTLYWLAISFSFAIATFLLLAYQITSIKKQTDDRTANILIPVISIIIFSLKPFCNWLLGIMSTLYMCIFFSVAGIMLLSKNPFKPKYFISSAIAGFIATFSFANGLLFWPIGIVIFLLTPCPSRKQKINCIFWWFIITVVTVYCFFYEYNSSDIFPSLSGRFCLEFIFFVFSFLGNPLYPENFAVYSTQLFSFSRYVPFFVGFGGVCVFIWSSFFLARQKQISRHLLMPFFCFCLYALSGSAMIAFGRIALAGPVSCLSPRFVTFGNLFWIGLLPLVYFSFKSVSLETQISSKPAANKKLKKDLFALIFVIVVVLSFIGSYRSREDFIKLHNIQNHTRSEFIAMGDNEMFSGRKPFFNKALLMLRKYKLSIFRESASNRELSDKNKILTAPSVKEH